MIDWQRHEDELATARLIEDSLRAARHARRVRAVVVTAAVVTLGSVCRIVAGHRH